MSTPIRAQDREHFSIVRDSLAIDGLHVAMVGCDRRRLQDYAGALARTLAMDTGLKVEAYQASRLESLVVDLMLHRFDEALSGIAGPTRSRTGGFAGTTVQPGCVLFVPDAQALPDAEFRQLLRITAGLRNNGLRLAALFNESRHGDCDSRIAALGHEVARWDLDDDSQAAVPFPAPHGAGLGMHATLLMPGFAARKPAAASRGTSRRAIPALRWLAATGVAASLVIVAAMLPASLPLSPAGWLAGPATGIGTDSSPVLTRSGSVELAGEPRRDYARAHAGAPHDESLPPATLPVEANRVISAGEAPDRGGYPARDGREDGER